MRIHGVMPVVEVRLAVGMMLYCSTTAGLCQAQMCTHMCGYLNIKKGM